MQNNKHIALVGGGRSNILTPVKNSAIEKWILPVSCHAAIPYADVMFELHKNIWDINGYSWKDIKDMKERRACMQDYRNKLRASKVPIYMVKHFKDIPMSRPFPFKEILSQFGGYFDNSVSFMLAMAIKKCIEEGYKGIQLYGMEFNEERHKFGKGVCEYYLGLALGMGLKIEIAPGSSLMKTHDGLIYGLDEPAEKIVPEFKEDAALETKQEQQLDKYIEEHGMPESLNNSEHNTEYKGKVAV